MSPEPSRGDRPPVPKANILLVDDQPANLVALEAILAELGQNLIRARSGEEALRHLLREDFAAVLLDVQMQGLDGFETARLIRSRPKSQHTPILFITAYDDNRLRPEEAYALGAVDYLVKPLVPVILRAKVAGFVELFRKTEEIRRLERQEADLARERAAQEELRRTARAKDAWISMLAHELRNPLAPLRNALHVLRLAPGDRRTVEQAGEMMERQVRQMTALLDDLLEASRISLGRVRLRRERLDLAALARTAAEDRRPVVEQAGLALTVEVPETPTWVSGDAARLTQVLGNLLDNAVKYTRSGIISVRVEGDATTGQAVLRVSDMGMGIEPDLLHRVFDPLTQADRSLDRSGGGLGLGLAVVKGLVDLHGGAVAAYSPGPGGGSEFVVRLALEPEPAALASQPQATGPAGAPLRVLIIEDNPDAAESLRLMLGVLGHQVRVACTGPAGVEEARGWHPQVVLCDVGLPGGLDGYGVAAALRQDPATAKARLIAVTGYGSERDQERARQAGFEHHLTKPADPAALLRLISQPA
jgi:signal transduction histidine kinase